MNRKGHRILCVAGEASGDRLLAPVVAALQQRGYRPVGVGGARATAAGLETLVPYEGLAGSGLVDAATTLPLVLKAYRVLKTALTACHGVVFADFPEVNTRLLREAHRLGLPSLYLGPPQAWAWRPWRATAMKRATAVGCLFEFEAEWFRQRGVCATWVGHPLAQARPLPPGGDAIALLPGSRVPRIRRLLPIMLAALDGAGISQAHLGLAEGVPETTVTPMLTRSRVRVKIHRGAEAALAASAFALVGAGTATLHAAIAGRPMVILGKVHPVSAWLARPWVKTSFYGLPNLVMRQEVFPECVQARCTADAVARSLQWVMAQEWSAPLTALRTQLAGPEWPGAILDPLDAVLSRVEGA